MQYVMVNDEMPREAFDAAMHNLRRSRFVAFDIETQGLEPYTDEILLYALKGEEGPVYLVLPHRYPQRKNYNGDILINGTLTGGCFKDKVVIIHNAAFEYQFMNTPARRNNTDFLFARGYFDTALAEKVLTNGIVTASADLSTVVKKYCGVALPKDLQKSWVGMDVLAVPTEEQLEYAAGDVAYLHDVMHAQISMAKRENLMRTLRLEMQAIPAISEMQLAGFYLNLDKHSEVLSEYVVEEGCARVVAEEALNPLWQRAIAAENAERLSRWTQAAADLDYYMSEKCVKRLTKDTSEEVRAEVVALRKERDRWKPKKVEDINLGSQDQVLAALKVAGVEPVKVEPDGTVKPSLDKNVLREWQHEPLVQLYTAWAKPNKVVTTYGETLREKVNPVTGRVHPKYNQIINSGRCSSSGPNGQNMPPAIRACFEAEEGNILVVADAANQEGRLAAALSKDEALLDVFLNGIDWHCMTAATAYPEKYASWKDVPKKIVVDGKEVDNPDRAGCKNANFSSIYGGTEYTLHARGYVPSVAIGKRLMEAVYALAPTLRQWSLAVADKAVNEGYAETIIGRKRYFRLGPKPRYGDEEAYEKWRRQRGGIRRAAMNHPVQGSGADVMKQAMIFLLPRMQKLDGRLVAFVHDELVYEVPLTKAEEAATMVAEEMERAAACFVKVLPIPGEVKITTKWSK